MFISCSVICSFLKLTSFQRMLIRAQKTQENRGDREGSRTKSWCIMQPVLWKKSKEPIFCKLYWKEASPAEKSNFPDCSKSTYFHQICEDWGHSAFNKPWKHLLVLNTTELGEFELEFNLQNSRRLNRAQIRTPPSVIFIKICHQVFSEELTYTLHGSIYMHEPGSFRIQVPACRYIIKTIHYHHAVWRPQLFTNYFHTLTKSHTCICTSHTDTPIKTLSSVVAYR